MWDKLREETREAPVFETGTLPRDRALERAAWWNWVLVTVVLCVTTTGLAAAVLSLLREQGIDPWPWEHSQEILLGGLVGLELLFIAYLTVQERRVARARRSLVRLQRETIERMERHYARLDHILGVTRATAAENDPAVVFDVVVRTCRESFRCDQVSLMLYDSREQLLAMAAAVGHERPEEVRGVRQALGQGVAGWVAEAREPLILGRHVDPARFRSLRDGGEALTAAMVVPIVLKGELLGVLSASSRAPGMRYDKNDLRALEVFAESAGISLHHAQQSAWMRETIRSLDEALSAGGSGDAGPSEEGGEDGSVPEDDLRAA